MVKLQTWNSNIQKSGLRESQNGPAVLKRTAAHPCKKPGLSERHTLQRGRKFNPGAQYLQPAKSLFHSKTVVGNYWPNERWRSQMRMLLTALKIYRMDNGLGQCMEVICTVGVIFGTSQMGWEMGMGRGKNEKPQFGVKKSFLVKKRDRKNAISEILGNDWQSFNHNARQKQGRQRRYVQKNIKPKNVLMVFADNKLSSSINTVWASVTNI